MCEEFLEFTEVIDVRHLTCLKLRQFGWRVESSSMGIDS
jgi:hypothetical protein